MKNNLKVLLLVGPFLLLVSTLARADCQADFKALMDAHLKAGSYHASSLTTMGDKTRGSESDVIPPDRFHVKSGPNELVSQDSIFTETGAWSKVGDGAWTSIEAGMATKAKAVFKNGFSSGYPSITELTCLGEQPIEGRSLVAYGFDNAAASFTSDKAVNYHIKLFVGDDHLPAIITSDIAIGAVHLTTISHISYDPTITIAPPKLN